MALPTEKQNNISFTEKALIESEVGIIILDQDMHVIVWNRWVENASGLLFRQVKHKKLSDIFNISLPPRVVRAIDGAIHHSRAALLSQKLNKHPFPFYRNEEARQRLERMLQMVYIKPLDVDGKEQYCLIQISDVTEAVQREKALRKLASETKLAAEGLKVQESHLRAIFQSTNDSILTFDGTGAIQTFNKQTSSMFKYDADRLNTSNFCDMIGELYIKQQSARFNFNELMAEWVGQIDSVELLGRQSTGNHFPVDLSLNKLELDEGLQYVAVIRDITERKKSEEKLAQLANYDMLTGLANRTLLRDRMKRTVMRARRYKKHFAIMFLDLDNFKIINDTKGHSYGDLLLKQVADRLTACVRGSDTVSRWGGDEFVILLESINDVMDVVTVAEKILDALTPVFEIKHQLFTIGVSVGISMYPDGGEDTEALVKGADTAMYEAKSHERGRFLFFDPSMNEKIQKRLLLEADLKAAIEEEQFELYLQPKLDIVEKDVHSAEALIRWNHPERGMVFPDEFINIAEETGLIWDIGNWVIKAACRITHELAKEGYPDFNIAVNLSPLQFQRPEIMEVIHDILQQEHVKPKNLELEMTEGLLMEQTEDSIARLTKFSDAGFKISIDDFGTGYSSLSYLRKFPLDHLKIDRSFVMDLPDDLDAISVSNAIINLAHGLRLETIAEGVETAEQLQFMIDSKCRYIQGYFVAKPMSVPQFKIWMKTFDAEEFLSPHSEHWLPGI